MSYTVASKGKGFPDFSQLALQEPWVANTPGREDISIGWPFTKVAINKALPKGKTTLMVELSASEIETYEIENVLQEIWIANSPDVFCRCSINDEVVCPATGCSPTALYSLKMMDPSLAVCCHIYDTTAGLYGIVCNYPKQLGRGYSVKFYITNSTAVDYVCACFYVAFQRKVKI